MSSGKSVGEKARRAKEEMRGDQRRWRWGGMRGRIRELPAVLCPQVRARENPLSTWLGVSDMYKYVDVVKKVKPPSFGSVPRWSDTAITGSSKDRGEKVP